MSRRETAALDTAIKILVLRQVGVPSVKKIIANTLFGLGKDVEVLMRKALSSRHVRIAQKPVRPTVGGRESALKRWRLSCMRHAFQMSDVESPFLPSLLFVDEEKTSIMHFSMREDRRPRTTDRSKTAKDQ